MHGIEAEIVETTTPEEESLALLKAGEFDAFVTMDIFGSPDTAVPLTLRSADAKVPEFTVTVTALEPV